MIIALIGQPGSGKTTLAKELLSHMDCYHIDGDDLRDIFHNRDYSRLGRMKNLNRASDIAHYLSHDKPVILSLIYPYKEARDYLNSLNDDVRWFCLRTTKQRKNPQLQVEDFEYDVNLNFINTDFTLQDCLSQILHLLK